MWETIIDNLLSNFIRYAESEIKITLNNGKITFYIDGPNIDQNIMDDIFDILSTAKIDIKEVDDLKCLKEKIIEYILKNSENPDFTKAYQYSQVNSSKELIKK